MIVMNDSVEGRQGLVALSDCARCPCHHPLEADTGLGMRGYTGICMLGKAEQPKLLPGMLSTLPCMNYNLVMRRRKEAGL